MAISYVVTGTVWGWIFAPGNLPSDPQGINLLLQKSAYQNSNGCGIQAPNQLVSLI